MTTIRPNLPPPTGHGPHAGEQGKLAAQRQFFAALGRAQGAASTTATAPPPSATLVGQTPAAPPAEKPQKMLRPGSLLDIRV